jgi:Kef-type K+ transport system membrane component KefB
MKKHFSFYLTAIAIFGTATWLMLTYGRHIFSPGAEAELHYHTGAATGMLKQLAEHATNPLSILLLQIIIIVGLARIFGYLFRLTGQPSVVGEIVAGIIIGPSVAGLFFPGFSAVIFPKESLINLQFLSQIGLAFFMFIVGMELDISKIKAKAGDALVISHATISFNYFLGITLSFFLFENFAPPNISFLSFALFMGIAMSITAFPVLARILQERKLTKTPLGNLAITCAAIDDITAWCLLALIIGIVKADNPAGAVLTISLAIIFVLFSHIVTGPLLNRLQDKNIDGKHSRTVIILAFVVLFTSAYIAQLIGIHALFGAFLAGTVMPDKMRFKEILTDKIEDVSVVILLPIFFAFTGLRTQIGLLNEGGLWLTCLLVIAIASTGKIAGATITSRLMGSRWKDACSLGVLMNTRGLMELVVLNIGYDLGILSPGIFAIMVLMALSTTFMTGPLLSLIDKISGRHN